MDTWLEDQRHAQEQRNSFAACDYYSYIYIARLHLHRPSTLSAELQALVVRLARTAKGAGRNESPPARRLGGTDEAPSAGKARSAPKARSPTAPGLAERAAVIL
jgi:hypothetical protein